MYFDAFMREDVSLFRVEAIPLFYGIISIGLEQLSEWPFTSVIFEIEDLG